MIIKRRGYKNEGLTFAEFISKHYLTVVVTRVHEDWGYFEATIESMDEEYYVAQVSGEKIRRLSGEGPTEAKAIEELAWQVGLGHTQHISVAQGVCIKIPTLRL